MKSPEDWTVGAGYIGPDQPCGPWGPDISGPYNAVRYFPSSHSVTWMRYSFHSRRLSSM